MDLMCCICAGFGRYAGTVGFETFPLQPLPFLVAFPIAVHPDSYHAVWFRWPFPQIDCDLQLRKSFLEIHINFFAYSVWKFTSSTVLVDIRACTNASNCARNACFSTCNCVIGTNRFRRIQRFLFRRRKTPYWSKTKVATIFEQC